LSTESDYEEIREAVDAVKAPGVFDILSVLKGRGYPETQVPVYMDENAIYAISEVKDKIEEQENKTGLKGESEKTKKIIEALYEEKESLTKKITASGLTVHLVGIAEGSREETYRKAVKKYPIEYEKEDPMAGLLAGGKKKEQKDSPQRDDLFTDFLWQEHIVKIVDVEGNEQTDFAYSTINQVRNQFPLSASIAINKAIEKLRDATALFVMETGEDFLAKP